jgi:large subunit ribosomal protein L25
MKLSIIHRTSEKKSDPKKNRREGYIPSVLYGLGQANQNICVKADEMKAVLRNIKQGLLPTTLFELSDGAKKHKAIVKDIQYHPTSYEVLHVDFALVSDKEPVTVNVPIQVLGVADCVGIKLGGFLRQVVRTLKVRCLPKDIPQMFTIDVRELNIAQSKSLAEIAMPEGVRPLAKMSEVAVVIAKKV